MKKFFIITGIIVFVVLCAIGMFILRYNKMASTIINEYAKIGEVDLSKIPDGVYPGKFGDFLVNVDLEVTVKYHKIHKIDIVKQDCGPGYEARDTVNRIIAAQSPRVDAVAGATGSSMCIMIAVDRALKKK